MAVIKLEDLVIAFQKALDEEALDDIYQRLKLMKHFNDAGPANTKSAELYLAEFIIGLYGFDYAIVDNRLTPKGRDIFYKLEKANLVYTKQEEVTIKKGKVWRLHYWFLNRPYILKLSRGKEEIEEIDEYAIYGEMDEDIWSRDENEN